MRFAFPFATVLAAALAVACGGDDDGGVSTATIVLTDDGGSRQELTVELARTPAERRRGLMSREELQEDGGMLFVFPQDTTTGFWMKDTLIPLSIAFIAEDGAILDVQDMEALSEERHRPPQPYRYALEVNQGWFQEHGLGPGDRVEIPDSVSGATAGE
ncbi:MAG: DUF192 domain-containing protein [Chloroflexi bacterium]|nr:DUF192 domain-containing protein [Chloroflexota bacterium]